MDDVDEVDRVDDELEPFESRSNSNSNSAAPRQWPRPPRSADLLGAILLLTAAGPAYPQGTSPVGQVKPPPRPSAGVEMRVEVGIGGCVRAERFAPARVTLDNRGDGVRGHLVLSSEDGLDRTEMAVELPRGARKQYTAYVLPRGADELDPNFRLDARLVEGWRTVAQQQVAVRTLGTNVALVASVTGDGSGMQFLDGQDWRPASDSPRAVKLRAVALAPADVPGHWAGLAAADLVVVNGSGWTALEPAQRRAVRDWVELGGWPLRGGADRGGRAILCGELPGEWSDADARSLVAIEPARSLSLRRLNCMAEAVGEAFEPPDGSLLAVTGPTLGEGEPMLAEGGAPISRLRFTLAGAALWLGFDPFRAGFRQWDGAPEFWKQAMQAASLPARADRAPLPPLDQAAPTRLAAATIPRLAQPPRSVIGGFAAAYVLLFGPVNLWLLRRMRRTVRAWLLPPGLALLMTLTVLGLGRAWSRQRAVLNQVVVLEAASGGRSAREQVLTGLFSPTNRAFSVAVEDPAPLFRRTSALGEREGAGAAPDPPEWPDRVGDEGARFDRQAQALYSLAGRLVVRAADLQGEVVARQRADGSVEVRNGTPFPLRGARLADAAGRAAPAGDLPPGARRVVASSRWTTATEVASANSHDFVSAANRLERQLPALRGSADAGSRWLVAEVPDFGPRVAVVGIPATNRATLLVVRVPPPGGDG